MPWWPPSEALHICFMEMVLSCQVPGPASCMKAKVSAQPACHLRRSWRILYHLSFRKPYSAGGLAIAPGTQDSSAGALMPAEILPFLVLQAEAVVESQAPEGVRSGETVSGMAESPCSCDVAE